MAVLFCSILFRSNGCPILLHFVQMAVQFCSLVQFCSFVRSFLSSSNSFRCANLHIKFHFFANGHQKKTVYTGSVIQN